MIPNPAVLPQSQHDEDIASRLRAEMGLITPAELAVMLNVKEHTLVVWRTRRIGPPYVKLGREIFYHDTCIRDWIQSNLVMTNRTQHDEDL